MTDTALVKQEIARFLRSSEPEVLCVRGEWGVGKTFTWKVALDSAVADKSIALKHYSYVSLFGIGSLEALKMSVFENTEQLLTADAQPVQKWSGEASAKLKKYRALAEAIPTIGTALKNAGPLYFSNVQNQIICIDDLERRSTTLTPADVLGLISYLKEQRRCKVVLLLNDRELDQSALDTLRLNSEKVIDVDLFFAPTPVEAAQLALTSGDALAKMIAARSTTLGISNIRVLRKIERFVRQLAALVTEYDPAVLTQAVQSLVLLGWAKWQPAVAPSLDFLTTRRTRDYFGVRDQNEMPADEASWNALLEEYEFGAFDDFDNELLRSLDNGYFDPAKISDLARQLTDRLKLQKEDGEFSAAWRPYHDSFDDDQDEVLDRLYEAFKKTVRTITPLNLNGTVSLFRELGRGQQADELLQFYLDHRDEPANFWDLEEALFSGAPADEAVAQAFLQRFNSIDGAPRTVAQVLQKIATAKSWDNADLVSLAGAPSEDYYVLFKGTKGSELAKLVSAALQFDRIENASANMRAIGAKARDTLRTIARESPINARRVRKFGIEPD